MFKTLRWIAYAIVAISAVLIIWSLIGTCFHHGCSQMATKEIVMMKHHPKCDGDSAKMDSTKCKHHEACCNKMAKHDSVACKDHSKSEGMEMMAPMPKMCCAMHSCPNLMDIAKTLLLLAIALLIISKCCCCCGGSCKCHDDKKESQ